MGWVGKVGKVGGMVGRMIGGGVVMVVGVI